MSGRISRGKATFVSNDACEVSAAEAALVDFGLSSAVLFGLMLWFGVTPSWTALWALPAILLLVVFLIGLALLLAAMQVRYRDVGLAMPLLLQVWLFGSPVLYALAAVKQALPEPLYFIYTLNPLAGIVDTFRRAIVLQQPPDYFALGMSAAVALLLLPVSYLYFQYVELTAADTI